MLESTYERRARQFVKSGRAFWVSSDTLRLSRHGEEMDLEPLKEETGAKTEEGIYNTASVLDDKVILDLARRRFAAKRNLLGQALDYVLILICMLFLIAAWETEVRFVIAFIFCAFWGIRFLVRLVRFVKPSFKDGIAAYLRERRERKIEYEYNRLKKMNAEYVAAELTNQ